MHQWEIAEKPDPIILKKISELEAYIKAEFGKKVALILYEEKPQIERVVGQNWSD